ncbi:MAG: TIGR03617 family F420-dependent LLM class oxidoreductase [Proteobacteria bacterium]|nr:TIGR03617 family F420-dependent LLM class oxidoreductase [Pseudomonadota bacterium]
MRVETGVPMNDWRSVAAAARAAEAAGFDLLVNAEIAHDPFVPLALAALETSRIGLGTGIVVAFPRSPMVVANTARDLQVESGGRFSLGLGSQVKGHNERRFSVPWSPPVPRLREYVQSLRAIWRAWETGEPLRFEGDHYRFTLMTPEFSPKPTGLPPVPVSIAAVGPAMMSLAARVCDGVKLHGFATRKYLEEVALPHLEDGLERTGRARAHFEISGGGFVATGPDDETVARAVDEIRYRIAFYGSTRSYHGVLACHGWEELGHKLHEMSKRGQWAEMAAEVPDEVVRTFAAVGTYDELAGAVADRFGGITDSVQLSFARETDPDRVRELVADLRAIPARFEGHATSWE